MAVAYTMYTDMVRGPNMIFTRRFAHSSHTLGSTLVESFVALASNISDLTVI